MAKYILSDIFQGDFIITQSYGQNPAYYSQFGFKGHEGLDFGTPTGTPVLAPFDGVVIRDDDVNDDAYGIHIVIEDKVQKCAVWFCHLVSNSVSIGQSVKRGQVIGKTGNTGNSSGPHLHFNFVETDGNGVRLNTNNGYKGFLNPLDTNLVEWKLGNSFPPATPPTSTEVKAAVKFDVLLQYLYTKSIIPSDRREDYLDNDKLLERIKGYVNNMEDTKKKYEALLSQPEHNPTILKTKIIEFVKTA